jgi:hypothetical protein
MIIVIFGIGRKGSILFSFASVLITDTTQQSILRYGNGKVVMVQGRGLVKCKSSREAHWMTSLDLDTRLRHY